MSELQSAICVWLSRREMSLIELSKKTEVGLPQVSREVGKLAAGKIVKRVPVRVVNGRFQLCTGPHSVYRLWGEG